MSGKGANKQGLKAMVAKLALPVTMAAFCVVLYLVTGPLKPEEPQEPEQEQAESALGLTHFSEFFKAAETAGFAAVRTELEAPEGRRSYALAEGEFGAELSLSLEEGHVKAFSLEVELPTVGKVGDGEIAADMQRSGEAKRQAVLDWVAGEACALLHALDGQRQLTVADEDAFLLLIMSSISAEKQQHSALGGISASAGVSGAGRQTLHIAAEVTLQE